MKRIVEKIRILCVDDDEISLELRGHLLEAEGYEVTLVTQPMTALSYDLSQFALAILDFSMPEINGDQLLLRLRSARAAFPILLLSGQSHTLPFEIRILFSACLNKSDPIGILLTAIRSFLDAIPDQPECSGFALTSSRRQTRRGL